MAGIREGNLEAPKRSALDWRNPEFYAKDSLYGELERANVEGALLYITDGTLIPVAA